jgi:hypothetical protein
MSLSHMADRLHGGGVSRGAAEQEASFERRDEDCGELSSPGGSHACPLEADRRGL